MAGKKKGITARQVRFASEYLIDLNATQAAIRAGYSKKTAASQGERLLRNVEISEAIRAAKVSRNARTEITQDRVLAELACLAFSNVDHYTVDEKGQLALADGAPASAMAAVASVKHRITKDPETSEVTHEVEFRLWDKPGPLKLAGRHVGLFPDKIEVTGKGGKDLIPSRDDALRALLAVVPKVKGIESPPEPADGTAATDQNEG